MIHSLFLAAAAGGVFMEKHWRGVVQRTAAEPVFEQLRKAASPNAVTPVISSNKNVLINIIRDGTIFIAVVQRDVPPLFVMEFLNRVADTLTSYFESCAEHVIKEHFVTVYELLEEMCDNGFPMTTEACVLKDVVAAPTTLGNLISSVTGEAQSNISSSGLPSGTMSNVPWRRGGVTYSTNEIFFDVIETLDQVLDKNGRPVSSEVTGEIFCKTRLSGMPDISLSFQNSRLLEDLAFHPCVRIKRWERESVLSFIPPDGKFLLASYVTNTKTVAFQSPVSLDPKFTIYDDSIKFEISARVNTVGGKTPTEVLVQIPFPPNTQSVDCEPSERGAYSYDIKHKCVRWQVVQANTIMNKASNIAEKLNNNGPRRTQSYTIRGTARLTGGAIVSKPSISVQFVTPGTLISGIKVNSVSMKAEPYKIFKGVKMVTKSGKIQHRT